MVSKEGHADILLEHERRPISIDFPKKKIAVRNGASYCELLWKNSPYLLNDTYI